MTGNVHEAGDADSSMRLFDHVYTCIFLLFCTLNIPCVGGKKSLFEDSKGVIRNRKSKKDRHYNGRRKKKKKYRQAMVFQTLRIKLKIRQREKCRLSAWAHWEVIR